MPTSAYDALILGGGIVGASTAYHLAACGMRVAVVDRQDRGRATDAAAGILSAETYPGPCEDWLRFSLAAAADYPELVAALQDEGEGDCGFAACGIVIVALAEDELPAFERLRDVVLDRQRRGLLPGNDELRQVGADEAMAILPGLARPAQALYSRRAARIDGRRLLGALLAAAQRLGVERIAASVDGLAVSGGRIVSASIGDREISAGAYVIAGGAWSAALGRQLGVEIPVAPQRGQLAHLRVPAADTASWPIVEGFRGHYLVPWPDQRLVAGATREADPTLPPEPTAAGIREVLDEAVRVLPRLEQADLIEVRVGLRPASADGLPVIGRIPGTDNGFVATGHGAHGLQLGPFSGKVLAGLIAGLPVPSEAECFSPARFIG